MRLISAGTFAYFQWTTDDAQRTNVNVVIEGTQITMIIEPEQTVFTESRPTADCENGAAYGDALVTIINNTASLAIPSLLGSKIWFVNDDDGYEKNRNGLHICLLIQFLMVEIGMMLLLLVLYFGIQNVRRLADAVALLECYILLVGAFCLDNIL